MKSLNLVRDFGTEITECGPRHLHAIICRMKGPNAAAFAFSHGASDEDVAMVVRNCIVACKNVVLNVYCVGCSAIVNLSFTINER